MPRISTSAKTSSPDVDNNVFSHLTGPDEFFHGKKLPNKIRWMLFKIKKKANIDYYKLTADTSDDSKFDFKFKVGDTEVPYSYNWPYDYFSLVELSQLEVGNDFKERKADEDDGECS